MWQTAEVSDSIKIKIMGSIISIKTKYFQGGDRLRKDYINWFSFFFAVVVAYNE